MLVQEKNYDFRKRMLEIHKPNIRNLSLAPEDTDFVIKDGFVVCLNKNADEVVLTAAKDFIDYLFTSMNISARLKLGKEENNSNSIYADLKEETGVDLQKADGTRGYRIDITSDGILLSGYDSRGIAQGFYYLEFLMSLKKAPFLKKDSIMRKPLFTPQMVHSGYGLDNFPNEHLSAIAHEGRDSILVFVKDVDKTPYGYLDFNELIYRASKYGIDVYAYSYLKSEMHPEDEGAFEHYDKSYGKLFASCPKLKGVILVGESVEFPSHDPHVSPRHWYNNSDEGIPTGKPSPGWYPCYDYPEWLEMIKKVIYKYNPEADIVFWTYNWTRKDPNLAAELIEHIPEGITVLSTFEKTSREPNKDGVKHFSADYTIINPGPSQTFLKESEVAKKRGIKLYTMSNTGGRTWDFGYVPYQPAPYSWIKRYKKMLEAADKVGLCGLMESHHYGFFPSFISKLTLIIFSDPELDMEKALELVLENEYGADNVEDLKKALKLWSDSTEYMTHTQADSYGPMRIGPAMPFCMDNEMKPPHKEYAHFGNGILFADYHPDGSFEGEIVGERLPKEIASWEKSKDCMEKGIEILEKIKNPNDELLRLINLGKYISCGLSTAINIKNWYKLKKRFYLAKRDEARKILDELDEIINSERVNTQTAIPLARLDSCLGWEPSMEYLGDEKTLNWKLRQLDYVQNSEIQPYRDQLEL